MSLATPDPAAAPAAAERTRGRSVANAVLARGEPWVWLTGGALVVALAMISGLLLLVLVQGMATFWPRPIERFTLEDGRVFMGEITRTIDEEAGEDGLQGLDAADGSDGPLRQRYLLRTGNFALSGTHFDWVADSEIAGRDEPEWATIVERLEWGRFYGFPKAFLVDGAVAAEGPEAAWEAFSARHDEVRDRWDEIQSLRKHDLGRINARREEARLDVRAAELDHGAGSAEVREAEAELERVIAEVERQNAVIVEQVRVLEAENDRYALAMVTADGKDAVIPVADVVLAHQPNRAGLGEKLGVYAERWVEFLADDPREANSEGGVYPAIFGTVIMTLIMTLAVVPVGVLAALYMREYARKGPLISAVRVAVNNLAGVPSIVFGVFGLGFFCYIVGGSIDEVFFAERLPAPTFGTGGILWASLTLALLTLPVVIVTTEEALAAVPSSMREGSYACGGSKWQTIRRIVLPKALPGIMTGAILAMARGAGEVAPLMLVGAVKLAPELPVDGDFPYLHPQRSFMHLGFHIFDLAFQSQNSEGAKPMVFTTTLLLITLIAVLNITAIWLRARLKRRFAGSEF